MGGTSRDGHPPPLHPTRALPACRHALWSEYKATRPETPPNLLDDLAKALSLLHAMGIPILCVPGAWQLPGRHVLA